MRSFTIIFLIFSLIFVISCTWGELKQNQVDPWLNAMSGGEPPQLNITGRWHDAEEDMFGWGEGDLRQEQDKISGTIGDYNVKGVVSGKIVYLVFLHHDRVYYTSRLEMSRDLLIGKYFDGRDKKQKKGYPTSLKRIFEPTQK